MHTHNIYLIRHGDVDLAPDICYGHLDCKVTDSFDADLKKLSNYFDSKLNLSNKAGEVGSLPIIITSPLSRCHQLANGLFEHFKCQTELVGNSSTNLPIQLKSNDGFKEINFGDWEGMTWNNIGEKKIEDWNENFFDYTFPQGESARSFFKRVENAWNGLISELSEKDESQTVVIISHAGVIRSILTCFLEMPLQHCLTLKVDKMSVSRLSIVPQQNALSRCLGINHSI